MGKKGQGKTPSTSHLRQFPSPNPVPRAPQSSALVPCCPNCHLPDHQKPTVDAFWASTATKMKRIRVTPTAQAIFLHHKSPGIHTTPLRPRQQVPPWTQGIPTSPERPQRYVKTGELFNTDLPSKIKMAFTSLGQLQLSRRRRIFSKIINVLRRTVVNASEIDALAIIQHTLAHFTVIRVR